MDEWNERLIFLLEEANIKRAELAFKAGLDPATINRYKSGKGFPSSKAFFEALNELVFEKLGKNPNIDWVILGRGTCYLDKKNDENPVERKEETEAVKSVNNTAQAKNEAVDEIKKIKEGMIAAFKQQIEDVANAAIVGLEKLRGVASVRLLNFQKQFVNTQDLMLCK